MLFLTLCSTASISLVDLKEFSLVCSSVYNTQHELHKYLHKLLTPLPYRNTERELVD